MLELIESYIDLELATIILSIIVAFIGLNVLFRKVSMPVVVHWLIIICVVGVIGFFGFNYLEKEEVSYFESLSNNYVVGKVQFVRKSLDKIDIKFVNSNMYIKNKGTITVHINSSTKYLLKQSYNPEVAITIDDLKLGDTIVVYCKEDSLKDGETEITARKIIKKES